MRREASTLGRIPRGASGGPRKLGRPSRRRATGRDGAAAHGAAQVDAASEAICRATGFDAVLIEPADAVAAALAVCKAASRAPRTALDVASRGLSPATSLLAQAPGSIGAVTRAGAEAPSRRASHGALRYYGL